MLTAGADVVLLLFGRFKKGKVIEVGNCPVLLARRSELPNSLEASLKLTGCTHSNSSLFAFERF